MRGVVTWVTKTYNNISILITESGVADSGTSLQDDIRVDNIKVREMLKTKYLF